MKFVLHIHIPIWQHGSCIHLAMPTKPPPILIKSLHLNNAIQITLYINSLHLYIIHYTYTINAVFNTTTLSISLLYYPLKNLMQIIAKNRVLLSLHQNAGRWLYLC